MDYNRIGLIIFNIGVILIIIGLVLEIADLRSEKIANVDATKEVVYDAKNKR
jgi:hypothetical protein